MKKLFVIATLIAFCSAGVATAQSADKVSQQAPAKTTQKDEKKTVNLVAKKAEMLKLVLLKMKKQVLLSHAAKADLTITLKQKRKNNFLLQNKKSRFCRDFLFYNMSCSSLR